MKRAFGDRTVADEKPPDGVRNVASGLFDRAHVLVNLVGEHSPWRDDEAENFESPCLEKRLDGLPMLINLVGDDRERRRADDEKSNRVRIHRRV